MSFNWNPQFQSEQEAVEPPPIWFYLGLYVIIQVVALAVVLPGLPRGTVPWDKVIHDAVAVPFFCWMTISFFAYFVAYDMPALQIAGHNTERWTAMTRWQQQSRAGVAVLDSVILTPEPDLAERMLALEGEPPENPGKVMALQDIEAVEGSRLQGLLTALLTPLKARLAQAVKSGSFDIVMQCDEKALSSEVLAAWQRTGLPGTPVIRWLDNRREVGFADTWFKSDAMRHYWQTTNSTPKYRLVLAWHLHREDPDAAPETSEVAVALLLGSSALMYDKPQPKHQAWLLRQISGEADQVDTLLASLLKAAQVPSERIQHFWHSRLKGLAQHATQGAVKETGLKLTDHALDPAIGPQPPVTRWVIQALAAKMAQFGQGAQLVALPHEQGVALNVVAKEPARVDVPWKESYDYNPVFGPDLGVLASAWGLVMLLLPTGWSTTHTLVTCLMAFAMVLFFLVRHVRLVVPSLESIADYVMSWLG